jgi:hypothetical protein
MLWTSQPGTANASSPVLDFFQKYSGMVLGSISAIASSKV